MDSHGSQETGSQPPALATGGPAIVRLPFMQPKPGNAFAQKQELEKQEKRRTQALSAEAQSSLASRPDQPPRGLAAPPSEPLVVPKTRVPPGPVCSYTMHPTTGGPNTRAVTEPRPWRRRSSIQHMPVIPRKLDDVQGHKGRAVEPSPQLDDGEAAERSNTPQGSAESDAESAQKGDKAEKPSVLAQLKARFNTKETTVSKVSGGESVAKDVGMPTSENETKQVQHAGSVDDNATATNPSPDVENAQQDVKSTAYYFPKSKVLETPDSASLPPTNYPPWNTSAAETETSFSTNPRLVRKVSSAPIPSRPLSPVSEVRKSSDSTDSSHGESQVSACETVKENKTVPRQDIQGIIMGGPSLSPTRQGTYATQGNPELVQQRAIPSMHGVVSTATTAGGWDQSHLSGSWQGQGVPVIYSPSVYDTEQTTRRPGFERMSHQPEERASGLLHVKAAPHGGTPDHLLRRIDELTGELSSVRNELISQNFQLYQLTAEVNMIRGCVNTETRSTVPTPTAAYRTPPARRTNDDGASEIDTDIFATGSPMARDRFHMQGTKGDVTGNQNLAPYHARYWASHPSGGGQQTVMGAAPFGYNPAAFSEPGTVPATRNMAGEIVDQSMIHPAHRTSTHPIVFGQMSGPEPVPTQPPISRPPFNQVNRREQNTQARTYPMVVDSASHSHQRRGGAAVASEQKDQVPNVPRGRFLHSARSSQSGPTHENPTPNNSTDINPQPRLDGTWGGTGNWYHKAYGSDNAKN